MKVLTVAAIKGGTGKTTTAAAIAQAAKADKKKVLVIDLDPQANLSAAIGADQNAAGSYQLFAGAPAAELIQHTAQGLDAIPASPDLATIHTRPGSAKRLSEAIQPIIGRYSLIVIDTPPTMGELVFNALQASDSLIIPIGADGFSLQALYYTADIAHQIQRSNPALRILGAVITKYDSRPKIARFMRDSIAERGAEAGAPLLMEIRPGVAIIEAQATQQSLFDYAPRSKPAQDYMELYKKIRRA